MEHQDWKTIVLNNKSTSSTTSSTTPHVNPRPGPTGVTERKYKEDEFGMPISKGLPEGFGKRMQQARTTKNLTQDQLAKLISERVQVVKDYESGKVLNVKQSVIAKLEKHLGKIR
jgi:ribosome-binding protein aMBF1 (putative translation factor)